MRPGERVLYSFRCARIAPFSTADGELLIAEQCAYFMDDPFAPKDDAKEGEPPLPSPTLSLLQSPPRLSLLTLC
jgi:hypothetical protein